VPHLNLVTTCQYISSHKSCILAINQSSFSPHEPSVQQLVYTQSGNLFSPSSLIRAASEHVEAMCHIPKCNCAAELIEDYHPTFHMTYAMSFAVFTASITSIKRVRCRSSYASSPFIPNEAFSCNISWLSLRLANLVDSFHHASAF
jgi:hypothetical protein